MRMNFEEIKKNKDYEYDFIFSDDLNHPAKKEILTINVKDVAEKLDAGIAFELLKESYEKILKSTVLDFLTNLGEITEYEYNYKIYGFIKETYGAFAFFYQRKNNKKQTLKFKTGESLTINENGFSINLTLPCYPVFWKKNDNNTYSEGIETNSDEKFFITEISKKENDYWKLEIIETNAETSKLYGRFKFFVKEGDTLTFKYYDNEMYSVNATVFKINYNEIELSFDSVISKPIEAYKLKETY